MASRVETPQQGVLFGKANPFTQETPMRTPVKEPGPAETASREKSCQDYPKAWSRLSAIGSRVWLWVMETLQ